MRIQKRNELVKMVAEDYKSIESTLFEYAEELGASAYASSLVYEKLPFSMEEKNIKQELEVDVNPKLKSKTLSVEEKGQVMEAFLNKITGFYRLKDK